MTSMVGRGDFCRQVLHTADDVYPGSTQAIVLIGQRFRGMQIAEHATLHLFKLGTMTMIKTIIAFAAAALFSLNASAGYIQYNLHSGESGLDGFIVQHDTDRSIAFFSFNLVDNHAGYGQPFFPFASEGSILLTSASNAFPGGGPTSFTIDNNFGADHQTYLSVVFSPSAGGLFAYTASYSADLFEDQPPRFFSGTVSGLVSVGELDPNLALALDEQGGYWNGVPHIVPTAVGPEVPGTPGEVPEPASLALLALGAAGLAGVRRRKSAR